MSRFYAVSQGYASLVTRTSTADGFALTTFMYRRFLLISERLRRYVSPESFFVCRLVSP